MMMQMGQQGSPPWTLVQQLQQDFNVKQIAMDTDKIDDDVKVLIVIHPKGISDEAQYAIDQFVLRGGKLIAFLDPVSAVASRQQNPMMGDAAAVRPRSTNCSRPGASSSTRAKSSPTWISKCG